MLDPGLLKDIIVEAPEGELKNEAYEKKMKSIEARIRKVEKAITSLNEAVEKLARANQLLNEKIANLYEED